MWNAVPKSSSLHPFPLQPSQCTFTFSSEDHGFGSADSVGTASARSGGSAVEAGFIELEGQMAEFTTDAVRMRRRLWGPWQLRYLTVRCHMDQRICSSAQNPRTSRCPHQGRIVPAVCCRRYSRTGAVQSSRKHNVDTSGSATGKEGAKEFLVLLPDELSKAMCAQKKKQFVLHMGPGVVSKFLALARFLSSMGRTRHQPGSCRPEQSRQRGFPEACARRWQN
ncbi:unnamed protein product [Prorocentrum cordatum]|uniref:Uncharacterized protein n=1 Tax=Prorocentrum cordatum TaxID=2364126 RepID=A0ABN9RZ75_9DINO|nr:unnamed protein product [Polarella glacialis]